MKSEWKDIASAPKDGRYLLLFGKIHYSEGIPLIIVGRYEYSQWTDVDGFLITPSHWMELPLPPEIISSKP